ncbi:MAG: PQQ-binding-like beta-propeller repeat protein [candidate division WOR-3 bacterium]
MRKNLVFLSVLLVVLAFAVGCRNKPPLTPGKPIGPNSVPKDSVARYYSVTTDPNRDKVLYIFDWDDSKTDTTSYFRSGDTVSRTHAWADTGLYSVRVKAKDARGLFSRDWSDTLNVRVYVSTPNHRPNAPEMPSGPDTGWVGQYQKFSTAATDPDGDPVQIRFIWGEDNRVSYWSAPVPSGTRVSDSVVYFVKGVKYIRAVAMDPDSAVSDTSPAKIFYANQVNTPPSKPVLTGPNRGIPNGPYYRFYAYSTDPQQDNIQYQFFWGDGSSPRWTPFSPSGVIAMDSCRYAALGTYYIKAIARDQYGAVSDTSDPKKFEVVGEGNILWGVLFGDEVVSSPALTDALNSRGQTRKAVVIGVTNGSLYAYDAYQGELLYESFVTGNEPYLSSPAVGSDGTVYIGNGNGKIFAYDRSGSLKWGFPDTISGDDMYASPLVDGNTIYVGGEDRYITRLRDDGSSVTKLWNYRLAEELNTSPAMDPNGNLILCDDSGYVYSFSPSHAMNPGFPYATFNNITSSPAIGADGTIYFGTEQGYVFAITSSGTRAWPPYLVQPPTSVSSSPVIGPDGSIYFGADNGYLYRLTSSGQPVPGWPVALCLSDVASTPLICADSVIYVTADNDSLYAVNSDGTIRWSIGLYLTDKPHKPRSPRRLGVDDLLPSPVVDQYGIIYVACGFDGLFAIAGRPTGTLANSPWPMFRHDPRHTGKYSGW